MIEFEEFDAGSAFAVFGAQDSGCVSYGVEIDGRRWFVKAARTIAGAESLRRAVAVHAAVHHAVIVAPVEIGEDSSGPVLVYPWRAGSVLNQATLTASDRSALRRFQQLPVDEVGTALGAVLDSHLAVADAGFVSVIDERTMVFTLGRTIVHLLDGPDGFRGTPAQRAVAARATMPDPPKRYARVSDLVEAWSTAGGAPGTW